MENELIKQIIEYIKSRWYRKSTLIILLSFSAFVLLWVFSGIQIKEVEKGEYWISGIIFLIIFVFWTYSNRLPKVPKGKIGFAVGIVTDDPVQHQKIKRDFIETLRGLLYKSKFKYNFVFIELPNHLVEKIDNADIAIEMLHEIRCAFMVYGKARTTTDKGQIQHVLDLEGVVAHKPIPIEISRSFAKEFGDLFPKREIISSEGDLFRFEITAKRIDIVSKYVIAIAALLSFDFSYAQELLESLEIALSEIKPDLPALIKIKKRLPLRLVDVYLIQSNILLQKWANTKDKNLLTEIGTYLDKLRILAPENIEARFGRSIWYFLQNRNISKAEAEILKARRTKHTPWQYNYAFLLAYEGNTHEAVKEYKAAVQEVFEEPKVILEIIEFIMWVLDVEPDKTQLHFCLGLIYYYAIKDYSLALQDFEKFLEVTPVNRFSPQRREAEKLIVKIQKDIKSGKFKFENEIVA